MIDESSLMAMQMAAIQCVQEELSTLRAERDALRTVASDAIKYMAYDVVACCGLKCREGNCESCFGEESALDYVHRSREAINALTAALASVAPSATDVLFPGAA
jgi:hypothetical protein